MTTTIVIFPEAAYESLAEFVRLGDSGMWEWGDFSADVETRGHWVTRYTGVEFMGDRESYEEFVIDDVQVNGVVFWNEDDEALDTDFDMSRLKALI